jgi:hypothetical protein
MQRAIQHPGLHYNSDGFETIRTNRTGGTTEFGGVYLVDIPQSNVASTNAIEGTKNVVAVTTALFGKPHRAVVALEAIANNAEGRFVEGDMVLVQVRVNSTTDIAKGDPLKLVNNQESLVRATWGTDRWVAIANEARTEDNEGLISAWFFSTPQF